MSATLRENVEIHGKAILKGKYAPLSWEMSNRRDPYYLWEFANGTIAIETNAETIHEFEDGFWLLLEDLETQTY